MGHGLFFYSRFFLISGLAHSLLLGGLPLFFLNSHAETATKGTNSFVEILVGEEFENSPNRSSLVKPPVKPPVKLPAQPTFKPEVPRLVAKAEVTDMFGGEKLPILAGMAEAQPPAVVGAVDGSSDNIEGRYLWELRGYIERHKSYPRAAQRLGLVGRVTIGFDVSREGQFSSVELVAPSPHRALNLAALNLIKNLGRYQPLPTAVTQERLRLRIELAYELDHQ